MTEEEYFRKNYPDSCYGERPLSPYWDFFQDGVEFGERKSEKKIEELKAELTKKADTNHSLVEQMADLESKNAELKKEVLEVRQQLELTEREWGKDITKLIHFKTQHTKAIGIIKRWYETNRSACIEPSQELIEVTEQFLKEIEK